MGDLKGLNLSLRFYNYSYIKNLISEKYDTRVFIPAIIKIAKKSYYIPKPDKKNHDRKVNTDYIGELIQHDTTHHLFAPYAERKWYLITSIDDFGRYLKNKNLRIDYF